MWEQPLTVVWIAGLAGVVLELIGLGLRSKPVRLVCYGGMSVLSAFAATLLLAYYFHLTTVLVAIITLYRLMNAARVIVGRAREPRLFFETRRASVIFLMLQLMSVASWQLCRWFELTSTSILYALVSTGLVIGLLLVWSVVRNLKRMSVRSSDTYKSDTDLPTVSVCIPARNETADLPACLETILASDYPKLEILVLDDCSQDKTSEIIKGFAQRGVRFVKGEEPAGSWLARNQALQTLAEAASGELLLFTSVDMRFHKGAIRELVGVMAARRKQMLSVLPRGERRQAGFVRSMRYFWELVLPRRRLNRPPVLSNAWVITRQAFFGRGEMRAVKSSVLPEAFFARELIRTDEYSFIRSDHKLQISSAKNLAEQRETGVRTRYPRLHQRPENVLLYSLAYIWLVGLPISLFIIGFLIDLGLLFLVSGLAALSMFYAYWRVLQAWLGTNVGLLAALLPIAVLHEIALANYSMYRYEFSTVKWKDRDICIPVMHHSKHLPKF